MARSQSNNKNDAAAAWAAHEAEVARRQRLTASLREQRLKRDAELAAAAPAEKAEKPKTTKRAVKPKG